MPNRAADMHRHHAIPRNVAVGAATCDLMQTNPHASALLHARVVPYTVTDPSTSAPTPHSALLGANTYSNENSLTELQSLSSRPTASEATIMISDVKSHLDRAY